MHEWGLTGLQNPVLDVRMPRQRPGRNRRLEVGEYDALLMSASADPNPWIEHAIVLAIETAGRAGELLSIRWDQISDRIITLDEDQTKNSNRELYRAAGRAMDAIDEVATELTGEERVFWSMS